MIRTDTMSNRIRTGLEPFHEYSNECFDSSTTASAAQVILNLAFFRYQSPTEKAFTPVDYS